MQHRNILKSKPNKKPLYITAIVIFFILFIFIVYITYCYNYCAMLNGHNSKEFDVELFMQSINNIGQHMSLSSNLLLKSLQNQLSLWWLHLSIVGLLVIFMTSDNYNEYKNIEHGSARFATEKETSKFTNEKVISGIPCGKDFYVPLNGKINGRRVAANLNEIVIGGSGAGKTYRKVEPDIMQMWGSYVVTDPKGELFKYSYNMLKNNGYDIKVLNLIDIKRTDSYNPFAYMTSEQDVLEICSLFMASSGEDDEKEDFWIGTAKELLTAISIYLFKAENEVKCFGRVVRLLNTISYDKYGKVDENCEISRCMARHAVKYPHDSATILWKGIINTPKDTMGSIHKTLSTRLQLWTVEDVDVLTAKDDMNFDSIGDKKTVIFLIMPVPRNPYKAVANIFYAQLFQRMFRVADSKKNNGRLKHLVSVEIDEFANIGQIPDFEKILAVVRSYNIRVCIILQDLSQLEALYKDTYRGIIANCAIMTFLGTTEDETLKKISERLGNISVETDSRSYNRTGSGGGQDTESKTSRPLLTPDEIKEAVKPTLESQKYDGHCIVWVGYERPFYLLKYDTSTHPNNNKMGGPEKSEQCKNNTYIEDIYTLESAQAKIENHSKMLNTELTNIELDREEAEEEQKNKYNEEQERFEGMFKVIENPPLSMEEEHNRDDATFDTEYIDFTDEEIYQSVSDYDEENNQNPVLNRIVELSKQTEQTDFEEMEQDIDFDNMLNEESNIIEENFLEE